MSVLVQHRIKFYQGFQDETDIFKGLNISARKLHEYQELLDILRKYFHISAWRNRNLMKECQIIEAKAQETGKE